MGENLWTLVEILRQRYRPSSVPRTASEQTGESLMLERGNEGVEVTIWAFMTSQ